jgi:hypothetical protein
LPSIVPERGANFPDALEQAVFADVNVRPDRRDQFLFAEHAPGIGGEEAQHVEGFGPKLYHFAVRPAQLGALLIE